MPRLVSLRTCKRIWPSLRYLYAHLTHYLGNKPATTAERFTVRGTMPAPTEIFKFCNKRPMLPHTLMLPPPYLTDTALPATATLFRHTTTHTLRSFHSLRQGLACCGLDIHKTLPRTPDSLPHHQLTFCGHSVLLRATLYVGCSSAHPYLLDTSLSGYSGDTYCFASQCTPFLHQRHPMVLAPTLAPASLSALGC